MNQNITVAPALHELREELEKAQTRIQQLESQFNQESQFYKIIDASPVPYALNDEELNITYLNPAFISLFGYNHDDIPTLDDWWPRAYPDEAYRQMIKDTWIEHIETSRETGEPFEPLELSICCKDGSYRTVLASAAALDMSFHGNHLVILYDITDRKQVESDLREKEMQLQEIIDHIPSMIFMKEAKELRYVEFNKAGEELTGVKRADILGKNDYDLWPKEQAEFFIDRDRFVLNSRVMEDIPDEPIDTPLGTRSLHTRKVSINDEQGNPKYLLGISDDISQQKEMLAERERLQHELQQAHKMESLGQLTGGIAHDFNNLLGIISGYTTLACNVCAKQNNEKLNDYLNHIIAASDRAISLVSQMLAFSRKEQGGDEPIFLGTHLSDDIKMLRAILPSTIELEIEIEPDLPPVLMNDTQLNQILMNLAVNARDAMDSAGRIAIHLGWARNLNAKAAVSHKPVIGDWIELSITDSGSGIESSIIDDVFTPYFTSKKMGEGTGMGLSVVYGIMQAHNGHILVDTEVDKGTTFRMLFSPVEDEDIDEEEIMSPAIETLAEKKNILVVDDEISLATFIGELVQNYGYSADVYTDSMQALEQYKKNPGKYAMLITDQTMPKLTGLDLIDDIREVTPDLPIILCSGYSELIDTSKMLQMGVVYLKKPVKIDEFMTEVNNMLVT